MINSKSDLNLINLKDTLFNLLEEHLEEKLSKQNFYNLSTSQGSYKENEIYVIFKVSLSKKQFKKIREKQSDGFKVRELTKTPEGIFTIMEFIIQT